MRQIISTGKGLHAVGPYSQAVKIRVSPHLFNSERDIDRLINVVAA